MQTSPDWKNKIEFLCSLLFKRKKSCKTIAVCIGGCPGCPTARDIPNTHTRKVPCTTLALCSAKLLESWEIATQADRNRQGQAYLPSHPTVTTMSRPLNAVQLQRTVTRA